MRFLPLMLGAVLLAGPARATVISVSPITPVCCWGVGPIPVLTYGQTITAPANSQLLDFAFQLGRQESGSGEIAFEAYVFAWDAVNDRATGSSLYRSGRSLFTAPASGFSPVNFSPNITLTPNSQYVLFLSTVGTTPSSSNSYVVLGFDSSNPYGGGQVVSQSIGTVSNWTTARWGVSSSSDLAITVNFGDAVVPEPSTYGLCGAALAALGLLRRKRVASVDGSAGSLEK
jgi:hypothetical protein